MKCFALVLSLSTLFLGAAPALAVPPESGSWSDTFNGCPAEGFQEPLYECGNGLVICELVDIQSNYKFFFDKNGQEVRYQEVTKYSGGWFEQGNPGNFLPFRDSTVTAEYDFIEDITSYAGNFLMLTIPGYGQVFRDVGRISGVGFGVYPPYTFYAGDHQWFDVAFLGEDDAEAACDYMSSQ
jgi:hypothetical protein